MTPPILVTLRMNPAIARKLGQLLVGARCGTLPAELDALTRTIVDRLHDQIERELGDAPPTAADVPQDWNDVLDDIGVPDMGMVSRSSKFTGADADRIAELVKDAKHKLAPLVEVHDVSIHMEKATAALVQVCIEEHRAKATQWSDENIKRANGVIVDLENQLLELEEPAVVESSEVGALQPLEGDPQEVQNGDLWYRTDLCEYRLRRDGETVTITKDEAEALMQRPHLEG